VQNCKPCSIQRVKEWKDKYPERYLKLYQRTYKQRDRHRRLMQKREIGTPSRCEICGKGFDEAGKQRGAQFDHNHGTGLARGWLCGPCNMGLGSFRDNPALLKAAAKYLSERGYHNEKPRIG
jgi:hypothetical protein